MASDFVVVVSRPEHFGSHEGYFEDESVFDSSRIPKNLAFCGRSKEYSFAAPGIDTQAQGVLMLELFDANLAQNKFEINGSPVARRIPISNRRGEWISHACILEPGCLHADGANTLAIEAGSHPAGGNRDNFIVNSVVVLYRLDASSHQP